MLAGADAEPGAEHQHRAAGRLGAVPGEEND
jgi:hypothetical protein